MTSMLKRNKFFGLIILSYAFISSCNESIEPVIDDDDFELTQEWYTGGENGTVFNTSTSCFEQPSPAVEAMGKSVDFLLGEAFFENPFVFSYQQDGQDVPFGGLGPVYIKESCIACHPGYGRSARTDNFLDQYNSGYIAFVHDSDGNICDGYQVMLQCYAESPMVPPAKDVTITWKTFIDDYGNKYPDGTPYNEGESYEGTLIYPVCDIVDPYYPLPDDYHVTIEGTMGIYGTGLLDAITDDDILAERDRQASLTGDVAAIKGVAGSLIAQPHLDGEERIGRFTWHNTRSTLGHGPGLNALYSITNVTRADRPRLYTNKYWLQHQLDLHANGEITLADDQIATLENELLAYDDDDSTVPVDNPIELSQDELDQFMIWHRGLAVPAARNLNYPTVERGKELFYEAKCAECHKPSWTTGEYEYIPGYSNQKIWPYTDLLMHEMGLDGKGEYRGRRSSYRTPAIWGRGLMYMAANHSDMFHDQRARSFEEAILWHYGEAEVSREAFRNMDKEDREALIEFCKAI